MQPDLAKVVDGGYCVGCGACAAFDPGIRIVFDDHQRLQAVLPEGEISPLAAAVCPFAAGNPDEDTLAAARFATPAHRKDGRIGSHLATYGGWVEENDMRARGSSGGIGTWLLTELLDKGMVDAVINVAESPEGETGPLFGFTVARNRDEVLANAKTRYYPVEMSQVLTHMRETPGRYAVIGVPCFVKAVRLAALADPVLETRVRFVIAIVCGHLKSAAFADAVAWQCDIAPDELEHIDFRAKLPGRPASRYGVTATVRGGKSVTRPMEGLVGANWGHGVFKLKACEFCDDVLGETADATVGDAWLPTYDKDHRGANVLVVRDPEIAALVLAGADEGRLHLDPLSADAVAQSQAGGLRHRRDGLSYRLWLTDRAGQWRPAKRVQARRDHLDPHMQRVHRMRYILGQKSHALFAKARAQGDLQLFLSTIRPLLREYDRLMAPSRFRRIVNRVHRMALSAWGRLAHR